MNTYNKKLLILVVAISSSLNQANNLSTPTSAAKTDSEETNHGLQKTIKTIKSKTGKAKKAVDQAVSPAIKKLNNTSDAQIGKMVKTGLRMTPGIPGLVGLWHGLSIVRPPQKPTTSPDETSPGEGTPSNENDSLSCTSTGKAYKGPSRLIGFSILYGGLHVLGSVYKTCKTAPAI